MSSFLQMGHDTENLVGEKDLESFKGIILSPVNRFPNENESNIERFRSKGEFEIVFDPQLYIPNIKRDKLSQYPYFPSDFDTADLASIEWWNNINKKALKYIYQIKCNSICSPVILPKQFTDEYYKTATDIGQNLFDLNTENSVKVYQTILVNENQLNSEQIMHISSICSNSECDGYYLIIMSETEPRRELSGEKEIANIMKLINILNSTEKIILISNASSEMILYKIAGATHIATGKFFNLRRFTKSRFEEPSDGYGGQLPYWFEHSLLAFLRQADILRLYDNNLEQMIMALKSNNHWSKEIINQLKKSPEKAWLALGWRQYLSWFSKTESLLNDSNSLELVKGWLKDSEQNWLMLEDKDIFMDEARNNGSWIRPWRQAISKYKK